MADWSATDDAELVRLAGMDLSASKIVAAFAELGLEPRSRDAILGRCLRIGVTLTGRPLKKPRPPKFWDMPEPLAMLRELWAEGVSVSQIGARMSATFRQKITRNAVIGKAHRLGLAHQFPRAANCGAEANRVRGMIAAREKQAKRARLQMDRSKRDQRHLEKAAAAKPILADVSFARPWMERERGQCAFPLGDRYAVMSCCFPTDETYCPAHRQAMGGQRKAWVNKDFGKSARAA
jgi:hypothetical protein